MVGMIDSHYHRMINASRRWRVNSMAMVFSNPKSMHLHTFIVYSTRETCLKGCWLTISGSQQIIFQEIISITDEITNWRYTLKKKHFLEKEKAEQKSLPVMISIQLISKMKPMRQWNPNPLPITEDNEWSCLNITPTTMYGCGCSAATVLLFFLY